MTNYASRGAGHTFKEIHQQPEIWRQTAADVKTHRGQLDAFLAPLLDRPEMRIVLTGAGSSAFAGQIISPSLSRRLARRVEAIATTDLVSNPREHLSPDVPTLLVSFARSGDSPESVAATELADQVLGEVHHLLLTCNHQGRLAANHDGRERSLVWLLPQGAHDQSFAMTSSFTSMTLAALLALDGGVPDNEVEALAVAAEDLLNAQAQVMQSMALHRPGRMVYLGSGPLSALARESALKMVEMTAGEIFAISDSSLGFRHGPKAVLTPDTVVVVYVSNDTYTRRYDLDIVAELVRNLGTTNVVTVSASPEGLLEEPTVTMPSLAHLDDALIALPALIVAQLTAMNMSLALEHTPDNPFPSGEVNRVVQGVTVHPLPK